MGEKIEALVLCSSENFSLSKSTSHQGQYEHQCGVKPLWNSYLDEQGVERNSILAGYKVYEFYLEQTGSSTEALKDFKGIESKKKMWIVRKVQRVMKEVKELHLKD